MSNQTPKISREEKIAALSKILSDQNRIDFADNVSEEQKASLQQWFIESLVDIIPDSTDERRRNTAARFILDNLPVVLHADIINETPPIAWLDEQTLALQINRGSTKNFTDQLNDALNKATNEQPQKDGEIIVAETDSARAEKGEKPRKRQLNKSGRALYDPQTEDLPDYARKHSSKDLAYFARMRLGSVNYEGLDTNEFENTTLLSQNKYETILEKGGGRWLWEYLHNYLISDEALAKKDPVRWFRDICVICGCSTTTLGKLTEYSQQVWSGKQNTPDRYSKTVLKALREALSIYNTRPIRSGHGRNTGNGMGYTIPEGSLFGLPVVVQEIDGKKTTIIDAQVIEDILKKLFVEHIATPDGTVQKIYHYGQLFEPAHTLQQIKQISDSWRQGKLTRAEVMAANPIKGDSKMRHILRYYLYLNNSLEYSQINVFLNEESFTNIAALCTTLEQLNKDKWHIEKEVFAAQIESLRWLPANKTSLFHTGKKRPTDTAWEFAKHHHNGEVGNLLATYRTARGYVRNELAKRLSISKNNIQQHEDGERSGNTTINRALSEESTKSGKLTGNKRMITVNGVKQLENMWLLPTEPNDSNRIRPDVLQYLQNKQFETDIPNPAEHWMNSLEVLNNLEKTKVTRKLIKSLRKPHENPLLPIIQEAVAPYEKEPLPLINLGDQEYLVKRSENGEIFFQTSDLERLCSWFLEHQKQAKGHMWQRKLTQAHLTPSQSGQYRT